MKVVKNVFYNKFEKQQLHKQLEDRHSTECITQVGRSIAFCIFEPAILTFDLVT